MRLKILCEDRCEDIAVNLAAACVRSLRRNDRLRLLSEPSHVDYMIDVYIVLLYKLKRTHDIVAQLKLMDLKDGLELMQRLSGEKPTKYGTARVWRNSSKAAVLVAQYLVTTGMIRPVAEVSADTLEQILNSWAILHAKTSEYAATLPGIIRKLIEPAESAQHIYIFCGVLMRRFGDTIKPLVIELYIRALTTDMNEVENQKSKSNKQKVQETEQRLSQEFLKLSEYVSENVGIARECVLTAFSLHPTRDCYDRIKDMAMACGKISRADWPKEMAMKVEPKEEFVELEFPNCKESRGSFDPEFSSINKVEDVEAKDPNLVRTDNQLPFQVSRTEEQSLPPDTSLSNGNKCHLQNELVSVKIEDDTKVPVNLIKEEASASMTSSTVDNQSALMPIKDEAVSDSANYDEHDIPSQVLDGEKLGISRQLCDDLSVVLSSQRYHVLTWSSDWKELSELCERYLENAEDMRNTNKELKYLNIDYSQFKDQPYEDDPRDNLFYGIEKGYEQWDDSDYSEPDVGHKSVGTNTVRRSLDESSGTDSENIVVQPAKKGRRRKVPRLESSESEYDIKHRKPRQRFRKVLLSSSESDTNTQDSQTDSLGSDGVKRHLKKSPKKTCNGAKKVTKRRPKKTKLTVDSVSHFHMLVNENIRPSGGLDAVGDNSSNDIMTLFSADMDENKRETIKGPAAFNAAQLIISEKRSDPEVIKSLRMFRHSKKLAHMFEKTTNNINNPSKRKENKTVTENKANRMPSTFAPMLSTLNLNPKIALRRVDEEEKQDSPQKKKQNVVTAADLSSELRNIQKTIPFSTNKSSLAGFPKQKVLQARSRKNPSKSIKSSITKSKLKEILTKSVPGMRSMEFSVLPRVQSTVHVVQLTRNIPQSPNSTASGNTPPRSRSNINQLPGTPSSGGHDSGVGMSPAAQTPPPPTRSSSLQDVGEEANQPPDTSPGLVDSMHSNAFDSTDGTRTVALAVLANPRIGTNQSPKKSSSSSTNNTTEQQLVLCKPDGTYHLVSPNVVSGQRGILSLQSLEDGNISFARQIPVASVAGSEAKTSQPNANRNAALPKFQQAFGKTICTLATDSSTVSSSSAADTRVRRLAEARASAAGVATNVQRTTIKSSVASNTSKSVQTSSQNASITNIPNLQVTSGTRQILNLVQSAVAGANSNITTAGGQTLQLCSVPNSTTPGVIYTHKIPVSLAGGNPTTQLISIPASISNSRSPVQVKLNIIRAAPFRTNAGAIQAVLASRIQQQPQQQQQQTAQSHQSVRSADPLINSTMEMQNQVSSSTLEQLREFESVLEQVKERSTSSSSQSSSTDTTTVQTQTLTVQSNSPAKQQQTSQSQQSPVTSSLTQQLLMSSQSSRNNAEFPSNGNTLNFQQQEVYPQKVALMYTNQNISTSPSKTVNSAPVVVVTSYIQPAASPALSVTSQSSSSPCVTPAPTPVSSTGKSQAQSSSKSSKKAASKTVKVSTQSAAKTPPIPKPQQKPQEDPETTQRIYAILGQYAEQLRNSPDLNNKPAPRRRSNPPTNPNQNSKRKKSNSGKSKSNSGQQTSEPSPSADDMCRTMGSSEDSSGGGGGAGSITGSSSTALQVQDSPIGFSASEDTPASSNNNSQSGVNDNATHGNITETKMINATSDSNDDVEVNVKKRNLIFAEPNTGQPRAVLVQEGIQPSTVGEALASVTGKMATGTAVLVSETSQPLQPLRNVKPPSSPVPAIIPVTTTSTSLDTATPFLVSGGPSSSDSQESGSSTIHSSALETSSMDDVKVENGILCGNARLQEAWEPENKGSPETPWRYVPNTNSLGMEQLKVYSRDGESSETVHNSVLQIINKGQGIEMSSSGVFQTKKYYHALNNSIDSFQKFPAKSAIAKTSQPNNIRTTAEQENQQRLNDRKQQIIERELRLQKSLSEECEDLGVDEPSTSDLFPEADLLFDTNHSPSFDHSSQEASCSQSLSGTNVLSGIKSYSSASNTSFFKSLDSGSSGSRDDSPVITAVVAPSEIKKKAPVQRRPAKPKDGQARRNKRSLDSSQKIDRNSTLAKQLRLSMADTSSQDEASNSNSDISRLSPVNLNNSSKESPSPKVNDKNDLRDREGTPTSSRLISPAHVKLDIDLDSMNSIMNVTTSDVTQRDISVNNVSSTASSGEEYDHLKLINDNAANVTIPSPLSPIAGPLLMTNRYTYINNRKRPIAVKQPRTNDFLGVDSRTTTMSWESPMSDRTRSSSDNDEDDDMMDDDGDESLSVSDSFGLSPQLESNDSSGVGNGLQEVLRNVPSVKVTPLDHATYSVKRKTTLVRRTINHRDQTMGVGPTLNKSTDLKSSGVATSNLASKKFKTLSTLTSVIAASENESTSPALLSDKLYDISQSDDEAGSALDTSVEHCSTAAARRSSLRGHVKKGCPCCNGSPERPKAKKVVPYKPQQLDQNNSKIKRAKPQNQQQLQMKQLAKKR